MKIIKITPLTEALSPDQIAIVEEHKLELKPNQCVANARLIGRLLDLECVEGVILAVLDDSRQMRYCRHCWNMTNDGNHFDATAEYCFPKQPDEIHYYGVASCSEDDYVQLQKDDPEKVFCSQAVRISAEFNYDMETDELKELEEKVIKKGMEYGELTDDLMEEPDSFERDMKILDLKDKYAECRECFILYKQQLKKIVDDLMENLADGEKLLLNRLANDILADTTNDTSRSRMQKLDELKEIALKFVE